MQKKTKLIAIALTIAFLISPIPVFNLIHGQTAKPKQATPIEPIRVACVGDSITQITNYTSDLQTMLGTNFSVGNFGVSGSTVTLSSFKPYMQQPQFQNAQQFNPNIVIMMLGTNDAHYDTEKLEGNFQTDYNQLINSFQNLTSSPQIFVVDPPPVFNNTLGIDPGFFANTIIPEIQNIASNQNLPQINVYNSFGDNANLTVDGIHPNSDGANLIATQVSDAITSITNVTSS